MVNKKQALGRGLSALLRDPESDITTKISAAQNNRVVGAIAEISINEIVANPFQPRSVFEEKALVELAASIKEHGIIQPVTVRKIGNDNYQLISGERRFRATQVANIKSIPAYIRLADDQTMLEMALVENIQRESLDAIEVAISFKRLIDECDLTQEQLSDKVSKNRSTVTNYLRLLKLPAEIQMAIRTKEITMGHAKAMLAIGTEQEQLELLERVRQENLNVRDTEKLASGTDISLVPKPSIKNFLTPDLENRRNYLSENLNNKVELKRSRAGKGKLVINFGSDSDLNRILSLLEKE
jgi:ParB family transcriptional regulator, chromosome partitioning protein|tara:strand:+ start:235 stop:1128 length:894 start_codon:yes stop_codon:yes gene_type:complete